ncbi:RabGAP/TBC [Trametes versicolor FP-101664 SS1]|uniref:RabGAP/TBC n=1 Tax=Trametes versicolor (strain FP-101664) TaxID=717944 RepID=UPI0004621692|nr:RabGAP/TBC [Trametes versicolor FP-101664 SS1]EIW63955.1 RabGAP/TBC [Trametes versicolor FP-101664 SS1]
MAPQAYDDDDAPHAATTGLRISAGFTLDDAFSDNDDIDVPEFSPAAVRKEFAERMNGAADGWEVGDGGIDELVAKIGLSVDPDASVSTFDIDAEQDTPPASHSPSPRVFPSRIQSTSSSHQDSLYDVPLSSEFSQVSLSDNRSPSPPQHDEPEEIVSDYPAVQIDLSAQEAVTKQTHPERTSVDSALSEQESSDGAHPMQHPQYAASLDNFRPKSPPPPLNVPLSNTGASSTSALPLPSSSSLPTPTTPKFSDPPPPASRHRLTRSVGPSMLDKVISKTRPTYLPPKPRAEDRKHQHDWEEMMKRSRAAEERRRKTLQDRRLAREQRIEMSISIWEREIVPDWTVVHRDPNLRRLWWQGIPTKLRAPMWQAAAGNALALSKDAYKTCASRAKRALASGSFPTTVLGLLEDDIRTTLPAISLFAPEKGPLYQDLRDMLCAWVVARSDEGLGYVVGVAKIAAMILLNMPPSQGFVVLRNVLERHCLRSFYGGMASKDDVEAYYRIFDTLLADGMPKIYFNFKQHQVSPAAYLPDWLVPLFLDHLPFEACARVWDVIMLEGDAFLYRAALAILGVLEPRLFFPDKTELLELLRGENKAALEVAKRDGRLLNNGKYEIYGVDEENLWERIDSMDEWWRESTWKRLIERELPDL